MKKKTIGIILGIVVLLLAGTGFAVYRVLFTQKPPAPAAEDVVDTVPQVDASVIVNAKKSTVKNDAIVLSVSGMAGKMNSIGYEVSYESKGLVKGVNSGSKPIDVAGSDTFEREIYLGTCSRNVCTPDPGVTKVSIDLKFTDTSEKVSTFSKDFEL
jgi:hypothetical protein